MSVARVLVRRSRAFVVDAAAATLGMWVAFWVLFDVMRPKPIKWWREVKAEARLKQVGDE